MMTLTDKNSSDTDLEDNCCRINSLSDKSKNPLPQITHDALVHARFRRSQPWYTIYIAILIFTLDVTFVISREAFFIISPRNFIGKGDMSKFHQFKQTFTIGYATIDSPETSNFNVRMRNLMNKKMRREKMNKDRRRLSPPNYKVVHTLEEYKNIVAAEDEKLVAVRFFAPWCKVRSIQFYFDLALFSQHIGVPLK
mmetsp:Transcript_6318/g.9180  ORF Transcript_6318/g.9180 Transcript_6318/m.9180 type:complete len:196 (+) Transcript_6318:88-675(+)